MKNHRWSRDDDDSLVDSFEKVEPMRAEFKRKRMTDVWWTTVASEFQRRTGTVITGKAAEHRMFKIRKAAEAAAEDLKGSAENSVAVPEQQELPKMSAWHVACEALEELRCVKGELRQIRGMLSRLAKSDPAAEPRQ